MNTSSFRWSFSCIMICFLFILSFHCKAVAGEKTITIGGILPLSGTASSWGLPFANGWRIACQDVNEAGGIKIGETTYRLDFRMMDSKLDVVEAVASLNKLIDAYDAKAVVTGGSNTSLSCQPITEPAKILLFTACWSDKVLGPDKKYSFRYGTGGYEPSSSLYKWVGENTPGATVAITNISYEGGYAAEKIIKSLCDEFGVKVVFSDFYPKGTTDFTPLLTKVATLKPTYYDTGVDTGNAPLLIKQLHELGYRGKVISSGALVPQDLLAVAGPVPCGELHVAFNAVPWDAPTATPQEKHYYEKFTKEAGSFTVLTLNGYTGAMVYTQAIRGCGSLDPEKIVAYLESHSFDTPYGRLSFPQHAAVRYGINHQIDMPTIFAHFVDKKGTLAEWMRSKPFWLPKK
jgi:branched-chain amino acid transport system substrate-binding protein